MIKLRTHNAATPSLTRVCRSEKWVLNKRDIERLETAQMKCLTPLLGITKFGHQRNTPTDTNYRYNYKKYLKTIQRNMLSKSQHCVINPLKRETEIVPHTDEMANSWMRYDGTGFMSLKAS